MNPHYEPMIPDAVQALRDWARERPDEVAVDAPGLILSAGELWDTAVRVAGWIRECGVDVSEAVGARVAPSLHPVFLIALLIRGGAGSLISGDLDVGPAHPIQRLIVAGGDPVGLPPDRVLRFDDTALARMSSLDPSSIDLARREPDDIVWLIFSSGTTGTPKAVMRTARAMGALVTAKRRRLAQSAYFSLQPGTVSGSMAAFLAAIAERRPTLLAGTAEQNLRVLTDKRIEIVEGSPFQLDQLLTAARNAGERLPALREVHSAGAPLSPGLIAALADWFGAEVYEGYGSTETGFVATRRVDGPDHGAGGATVMDGVTVEIVDDDRVLLPDGHEGRLRLRAPAMAVGYAGDPDLGPLKGFHEGWFYPGDLGRLESGRLVVLGREDELINVAGRKIVPQVVENAVRAMDGVQDAVACAVTDRLGIRQLAIAVVGDAIGDPLEFARSLDRPLGGVMPSLIMRVASIPRTDGGKPKRLEMAELLQQQLERPAPLR